ncbi:hypothetical protein CH376_23695 [Leptospira adleri]|uniref:Uncharacterized protein n=1 Tax=Leptospira adleri TaxID=2023186 RepID=A0ABX4NUK4_9LEPT|nr:hypothetical protein CH376_23695 [Leptospira adleri]
MTLAIIPSFLLYKKLFGDLDFDTWIGPLSAIYSIVAAFLSVILIYITSNVNAAIQTHELKEKFRKESDTKKEQVRTLLFCIKPNRTLVESAKEDYQGILLDVSIYSQFLHPLDYTYIKFNLFLIKLNIYIKYFMRGSLLRIDSIYQKGIYDRY